VGEMSVCPSSTRALSTPPLSRVVSPGGAHWRVPKGTSPPPAN